MTKREAEQRLGLHKEESRAGNRLKDMDWASKRQNTQCRAGQGQHTIREIREGASSAGLWWQSHTEATESGKGQRVNMNHVSAETVITGECKITSRVGLHLWEVWEKRTIWHHVLLYSLTRWCHAKQKWGTLPPKESLLVQCWFQSSEAIQQLQAGCYSTSAMTHLKSALIHPAGKVKNANKMVCKTER